MPFKTNTLGRQYSGTWTKQREANRRRGSKIQPQKKKKKKRGQKKETHTHARCPAPGQGYYMFRPTVPQFGGSLGSNKLSPF